MLSSRLASGALVTLAGGLALAIASSASTRLGPRVAPGAAREPTVPTSRTDGGLRRVDPVRPPADWLSSLWKISFHLEDIADVQSADGMNRRTTHFRGMTYGVGPFPDMFVSPAGIQGEFDERLDIAGNAVDQVWKSAGAPALPASIHDDSRHELLVGRHVKVCADSLSVQTAGSRNVAGTPNTFVLSNNFRWKASITQTIHKSPPVHITTDLTDAQPLYTATEAEVPYNYRELVNRGAVDVPFYSGAPRNGVVGPYRKIKRLVSYRITRMPMEMEFLRQCRPGLSPPHCVRDLVGKPNLICSTCTGVTDYYAYDGASAHFVHPNVEIRLLIDGEDVTKFVMRTRGDIKYFDVARRRRAWSARLGVNDQPVGRWQLETLSSSGWVDDPSIKVGSGNFTEPNWYDMPAPMFVSSDFPRQRFVQEFLVGVKKFPEFGFLHYAITIDTKPGWYRVQKSQAKEITADEWCRFERTRGFTPDTAPPLDDSGWLQVPR
jgi:hypothetical protein